MKVFSAIKRKLKRLQGVGEVPQRAKVFCIGANKTGTTTLENVLRRAGYQMPDQSQQERLTVEELHRGNYEPLISLCKNYEAFQDQPFSTGCTYAVLDAFFPRSKFILTVRESDTWFESVKRYSLQGILKQAGVARLEDFCEESFKDKAIYLDKNYCYNNAQRRSIEVIDHRIHYNWNLAYQREHCISLYERRNNDIVKHFHKRTDQLLIIDFSKEKDNSKIIKFLGLPDELISSLPHLNKSL